MDHRHWRHFIWTLHHQQSLLVLLYWSSLLLYRQVARAFKVQECCNELMMLAAVNCSLTDANLTFCCCNLTKYAWSWADSNCMTNKATTRHYPLKINIIYIPHLTSQFLTLISDHQWTSVQPTHSLHLYHLRVDHNQFNRSFEGNIIIICSINFAGERPSQKLSQC